METYIPEVKITQVRGHWEIYLDGEFYCSTDSYIEAVEEAANIL